MSISMKKVKLSLPKLIFFVIPVGLPIILRNLNRQLVQVVGWLLGWSKLKYPPN